MVNDRGEDKQCLLVQVHLELLIHSKLENHSENLDVLLGAKSIVQNGLYDVLR